MCHPLSRGLWTGKDGVLSLFLALFQSVQNVTMVILYFCINAKAMALSKEPKGKKVEIQVNGEVLEQVDTFKYLGTQIKDDLKTDKELETRENLARSKFCSLHKILTSKRLKMSTRLNILKCYVFSIYCYGCEGVCVCVFMSVYIQIIILKKYFSRSSTTVFFLVLLLPPFGWLSSFYAKAYV